MARKNLRSQQSDAPATSRGGLSRWPEKLSPAVAASLVFGWGLGAHLVSLLATPLAETPIGLFFFGDSPNFLEQARRMAHGEALLNFGLPFHPPLVSYLLTPLWWLFATPAATFVAAKALMAVVAAAGYALFFRLVRQRLPHAFWICLLVPLSFGELALASAVSSELVYRLLLLALFALGWRWPVVGGVVHGLACLARAEHLVFALGLALVAAWKAERRPWLLRTLAGAALVLVPQIVSAHKTLSDYNRDHAAELPGPLPVWVPVSFYGPLNFALAQREETIHFGRETLPPAPGGSAALDPAFAPHHQVIVHGYALGWRAIREAPLRFVRRSGAKLRYSFESMAFGWTWRDGPKPGRWIRQPVDVASSQSSWWSGLCLVLVALGAWRLRQERALLAVAAVLLLYRLGVNTVFFPYLRGVLVLSPLVLAFQLTAVASLAKQRGAALLAGLLLVIATLHFATLAKSGSGYRLSGERRDDGSLIDDRPVVIERSSEGSAGSS